ncbi:MAG: nitronate monooxygenase [Cyclobacteriaceae bacterium]|nr:nitronate monooxygenase [Cyclobacteriaceae bacterium]
MTMTLDKMLGIDYPIIVAPMFLISNTKMVKAALDCGITAAFPALNYRTDQDLREAIADIRAHTDKPFGVNLIVNKSNYKYNKQLETLVELKPAFIITSLGKPEEVIRQCKPVGIKVFCDVIDEVHAKKVEALGADAVIAVNNQAGGHTGKINPRELVELLQRNVSIPVISAGGVASVEHVNEVLSWGAAGVSVGTIFIASEEADVSADYKQALIDYGAKDIVKTTKLSGSPLTVINTPYVQQLGTEATWWEKLMNNNKWLKKYIRMIIALRGMKTIEKSTFGASYKTLWCAGPTIEYVHSVRPMREIIHDLTDGLEPANKVSVS